MATVSWEIKGLSLNTCNCDWGCPCQFNARPTHGHCRAAIAARIDAGHFGEERLDGVHFAGLFAWPGAIHEGGGEMQPILDERASEAQRAAVLTIMRGEETEPGATIFNVFQAVIDTVYEPLVRPIDIEADLEARTGGFTVAGVVEARVEPIRNPITGDPHRARVELPHGFEYKVAEYASSTTRTLNGSIPLEWAQSHAHLQGLHWTPQGPVA